MLLLQVNQKKNQKLFFFHYEQDRYWTGFKTAAHDRLRMLQVFAYKYLELLNANTMKIEKVL